jgi:hypothetical protein
MRILLVGIFCLWGSLGLAQNHTTSATANYALAGCKTYLALIEGRPAEAKYAMQMGFCQGSIDAIAWLNSVGLVLSGVWWCVPQGVDNDQMLRVVIRYVDARPQRHHESFALLALEALAAAWPCKQ